MTCVTKKTKLKIMTNKDKKPATTKCSGFIWLTSRRLPLLLRKPTNDQTTARIAAKNDRYSRGCTELVVATTGVLGASVMGYKADTCTGPLGAAGVRAPTSKNV